MNNIPILNNSQSQNFSIGNVRSNSCAQQPSFRGAMTADEIMVTDLSMKEIASKFGRLGNYILKASNFLNKHAGELQNQGINALFTATLAPFFIAYNPLSKQDQKTKEYTALRQPVSAGIALTGGVAMTVLINNFMNKLFCDGNVESVDGRIMPDENYLESEFKNALNSHSSIEDKQKFLDSMETSISENDKLENGAISKKYQTAGLEAYTKNVQTERQNLFSALHGADPKQIQIAEDGSVTAPCRNKDNKIEMKKFNPVPNFDKANITEYIKTNNVHNMTLGDLLHKHFGINIQAPEGGNEAAKITPSSVKDFAKIKAMDFVNILGITGDKTQIKDMDKVNSKDLGKLLLGKDKDLSKMNLDELFEELGFISPNDPSKKTQEKLELKNNELNKIINNKLMDSNMAAETDITKKPLLKLFEEKINKNSKSIYNYVKDVSALDFSRNNIAKTAKTVGKHFSTLKSFTGILFNLGTTAITCTALNWAYPRFVETFFPDIAKSDKPKPKQTEVQAEGGNK